eukprot:SAG11_NODE_15310_length_582_cov_0.939959_1_plen_97_part_01
MIAWVRFTTSVFGRHSNNNEFYRNRLHDLIKLAHLWRKQQADGREHDVERERAWFPRSFCGYLDLSIPTRSHLGAPQHQRPCGQRRQPQHEQQPEGD